MKKAAKLNSKPRQGRTEAAEDRQRAKEVRRDDAQPDSPGGAVNQDPALVGARRFPRKGDDDLTP